MKVAYTINGLVGGLSGKNYERKDVEVAPLILKYVSNTIKKYICTFVDVDFYIFSWEPELEKEFKKCFNPIDSIFTEQIKFDIPLHIKNDIRTQSHISRWYGVQQVNNLVCNSNIDYDLIVNARIDLAWNTIMDFNKLNTEKIHCAYHPSYPNFLPKNPKGVAICDHIVAMNPLFFNEYSKLFNYFSEYSEPKNHKCDYSHISNHLLIPQHFRRMGIVDMLSPTFLNHHDVGKGTGNYDIFRYKKLTKKELIYELQRR